MPEDRLEPAIMRRLKALTQLETCSPFTRSFFSLIGSLLVQSRESAEVGGVLCDYLDLELWYYHQVGGAQDPEGPSPSSLRSLNEKRRISLQAFAEQLERLAQYEGLIGAARHLLLAECYYHLDRREEVITELRAAVDLGCDRPIVCFALGYNLFHLAIERYTSYLPGLDGYIITDRSAFVEECEKAMRAFSRGFADSSFDAQIHWWIGTTLESMGRREDAAVSYRRSERSDPLNFRAPVARKLQLLGQGEGPPKTLEPLRDASPSEREPYDLDGPGEHCFEEAADPDEVRRFADLLRRAPRLTRMLASDEFAEGAGDGSQ